MPAVANREKMKVELCKILNRIGALQFGTFKLTTGKISPYYVDLRVVPSFPDAFQKVCSYYMEFIKDEIDEKNFERIAGIPIAGIPFASIVAYNFNKPFIYIRKGVRLHGRQRRIEGIIAPGDRVLLVDDLITTGLSLRKACKAITAEGGVVNEAAVLIDRQESGKERLAKDDIRLHALLNISEIANTMRELGTIDEEQMKTIQRQVKKK